MMIASAGLRDGLVKRLEASLMTLGLDWTILADLRIDAPPDRVAADYLMLHRDYGVALVNFASNRSTANIDATAIDAFRRFLYGRGFDTFFPGYLPVVRFTVTPQEVTIAGRLVLKAFADLPRLTIKDPEWADAVDTVLTSVGSNGTISDLSEPPPPDREPIAEPARIIRHDPFPAPPPAAARPGNFEFASQPTPRPAASAPTAEQPREAAPAATPIVARRPGDADNPADDAPPLHPAPDLTARRPEPPPAPAPAAARSEISDLPSQPTPKPAASAPTAEQPCEPAPAATPIVAHRPDAADNPGDNAPPLHPAPDLTARRPEPPLAPAPAAARSEISEPPSQPTPNPAASAPTAEQPREPAPAAAPITARRPDDANDAPDDAPPPRLGAAQRDVPTQETASRAVRRPGAFWARKRTRDKTTTPPLGAAPRVDAPPGASAAAPTSSDSLRATSNDRVLPITDRSPPRPVGPTVAPPRREPPRAEPDRAKRKRQVAAAGRLATAGLHAMRGPARALLVGAGSVTYSVGRGAGGLFRRARGAMAHRRAARAVAPAPVKAAAALKRPPAASVKRVRHWHRGVIFCAVLILGVMVLSKPFDFGRDRPPAETSKAAATDQPLPPHTPAPPTALATTQEPTAPAAAPPTAALPPAPTREPSPPPVVAADPPVELAVAPSAMPPALDRARLDRDLEELFRSFGCADLNARVADDGTVTLTGFVSKGDDLARLTHDVSEQPQVKRVDSRAEVEPWPFCELSTLLSGRTAHGTSIPQIEASHADRVYRGGDALIVAVTAHASAPSYLYVDFYDSTGAVVHMLPTPLRPNNRVTSNQRVTIGTSPTRARRNERIYVVAPPFGMGRLVAMSSPHPLFASPRPEQESAKAYLGALAHALAEDDSAVTASQQPIVLTAR